MLVKPSFGYISNTRTRKILHCGPRSVDRQGAGASLQVDAAQGRRRGNAFETQQLAGGRVPVQTQLQPAVDGGVLAVGPAGPVHGSLHCLPARRPEGSRRTRRRTFTTAFHLQAKTKQQPFYFGVINEETHKSVFNLSLCWDPTEAKTDANVQTKSFP